MPCNLFCLLEIGSRVQLHTWSVFRMRGPSHLSCSCRREVPRCSGCAVSPHWFLQGCRRSLALNVGPVVSFPWTGDRGLLCRVPLAAAFSGTAAGGTTRAARWAGPVGRPLLGAVLPARCWFPWGARLLLNTGSSGQGGSGEVFVPKGVSPSLLAGGHCLWVISGWLSLPSGWIPGAGAAPRLPRLAEAGRALQEPPALTLFPF